MKVLIQRVRRSEVRVDGTAIGATGAGLVVLLGVERDDDDRTCDYLADRTAGLRIFPDADHNMNRSVEDVGGEVLVVSQFTLASSTRRGRRPSFTAAAPPDLAEPLYERFCGRLEGRGLRVARGRFQAMMEVELVNDGPVTIILDPPPWHSDATDGD